MESESQFTTISSAFSAALDHPAGAERDAVVSALCNGDPAAIEEVRSLLAAHEAEVLANEAASRTPEERRRFGPYESLSLIGRGGMGIVYLGRRVDGQFDRAVAIKTLNAALIGGEFESRFRAERQILAFLNHPNITRMLDGGSERGEPYLVMEYVDGEHLDSYCDSRRLGISERIELFLQVCSAVSYAHGNLVVHRDLKPSNILVDKTGRPHLLDFGVARLLGENGDETRSAIVPGTARYASPEQVKGLPVTTAADQFSAAVVLYELLTGAWPFGDYSRPMAALERVMKETRPMPPAEALSEAAAEARGSGCAPLRRALRGDLSTILFKALDDQPDRRYASVSEFAADLRHYLDGEPVTARRLTFGYRTGKFLRRHWLAAAAATVGMILVSAGMVLAIQSRRVAETRFQDVRSIAKFVLTDLDDQVSALPGSTRVRASMAERSMAYLDSLRAQAGAGIDIRLELAEGYLRLGNVWGNLSRSNLGDPQRARLAYKKGLALAEEVARQRPKDLEARRMLAKLEMNRALMESLASSSNDDIELATRAIGVMAAIVQKNPGSAADQFQLGQALAVLASVKQSKGGLILTRDAAHDEAEQARQHLEKAVALAPAETEYRMALADLHERRALAKGTLNPNEAIEEHDRALEQFTQLSPAARSTAPRRHWLARSWMNRAWALGQAQRYAEAFEYLEKARPVMEQLRSADPADTRISYDSTALFRAWGIIANYAGRKREAIERFASAIRIYDEMPQLTDPLRFLRSELVMRTANLHDDLGEHDKAAARAREAFEGLRPLIDRPNASVSHLLAAARLLSGEVAKGWKEPARAVGYAQRAVALAPQDVISHEGLAACYYLAGRRTEAIAEIEEALRLSPPPAAGEAPSLSRRGLLTKLEQYRKAR